MIIFSKESVFDPMELVPNRPMSANTPGKFRCGNFKITNIVTDFMATFIFCCALAFYSYKATKFFPVGKKLSILGVQGNFFQMQRLIATIFIASSTVRFDSKTSSSDTKASIPDVGLGTVGM